MRWAWVAVAATLATVGCTGSVPPGSTAVSDISGSSRVEPPIVELPSGSYRVGCAPVPEQMLDVKISTAGSAAGITWAIAGIPSSQAIAVPATGSCGPYSLAVSERVSPETAEALTNEVRALQDRFGSVPPPG
jgi:hypothetical protein